MPFETNDDYPSITVHRLSGQPDLSQDPLERKTPMTTATSRTDVNRNREETSDPQHASFRDVKEDVNRLKQDASKCASDVADSSLAVARSGAAHAMESGRKVADSLKETHERVCDYVTANPTTSILIAAGVGALLARFLPRG